MDTCLVDCHVHTRFSDGVGEPQEVMESAQAKGLQALVFSDHLTLPHAMDPHLECSVAEDDLAPMVEAMAQAAASADFPVFVGAECDWYRGCEEAVARWSSWAKVRLGSVHWVDHGWIDDPGDDSLWEELGPDGLWRAYVEAWCAACESPLEFDSMAHPDLPRRFEVLGWRPTIALEPLWDTMVLCARDTGRRIEVSSAAWRKGLDDPYPAPGLLERFCRAGVPITFGSDAHRPEDVGGGLVRAHGYAWDAGYRFQEVPVAPHTWEPSPLG